jgi:hypothetical protein
MERTWNYLSFEWGFDRYRGEGTMVKNVTKCPNCGSDAYYRYGRTKNNKLRRLCLVCDRQYVVENSWKEEFEKAELPGVQGTNACLPAAGDPYPLSMPKLPGMQRICEGFSLAHIQREN